MAANPRQALHDLVDRLSDAEADHLSAALQAARVAGLVRRPRPLTDADIVLDAPIMPEDETADAMIAAVHQWRREGGYA